MATEVPPFPAPVWPSMEALDESNPLRQLYPEDLYPNGGYFQSPYGRTKYWIVGPETAKKVVLIHGITAPSLAFKDIVSVLSLNGFRVLLYDVAGRGYSQAPQIPHEANVYTFQLAFLLQYIGWSKVDVVGFSMGGAVAVAFASSFPHLIDRHVALLASAGLMEMKQISSTQKSSQSQDPNVNVPQAPPAQYTGPDPLTLRLMQEEHLSGFRTVLASSIKYGILYNLHSAFESLSKTDKKFLLIHGTADSIVPFEESNKIKKLIPQAELFPLEGASHYLPIEANYQEKVANKLVEFLS